VQLFCAGDARDLLEQWGGFKKEGLVKNPAVGGDVVLKGKVVVVRGWFDSETSEFVRAASVF